MKPVFILAALLTFVGLPGVADPPPVAAPPASTPFPAPPFDENVSVIIPFEMKNFHILVKARLNGQEARLIVDTGAARMVLTPKFGRKLGWKGDGEKGQLSGIGGIASARWMNLKTLMLGRLNFKGGDSGAWIVPSLTDFDDVADGFIGYELFYSPVVTIDYANSRLIVTRPEDFKAPNEGLPLRTDDDTPAVEAVLDGRHVWLQLDTGDPNLGINLNVPFVMREKLRQQYVPHYTISTGAGIGGPTSGDIARAKTLTIGEFTIPKPLVSLSNQKTGAETESDVDGRIGNAILSNFYVTLDYGRKRLYLTPRHDLTKIRYRYPTLGFAFNSDVKHKIFFKNVTANGSAAQAGIRNGDEVLAFNDVPLEKLRGKTSQWSIGDKIKFLVRRKPGMKPFTATTTVRELL